MVLKIFIMQVKIKDFYANSPPFLTVHNPTIAISGQCIMHVYKVEGIAKWTEKNYLSFKCTALRL